MASQEPPLARMRPHYLHIPPGTILWRVHEEIWKPSEFNPQPAHSHFGGGRFDSTSDDPYGFLYAADTMETALAERLLRNVLFASDGYRYVQFAGIASRSLSALRTTCELMVISLITSMDLAAIGQDEWLVTADGSAYAQTRAWVRHLRAAAPTAQGLIWQSNRDRPNRSLVLFEDRCPGDAIVPATIPAVRLGNAEGVTWLNEVMARYRLVVDAAHTTVAASGPPFI